MRTLRVGTRGSRLALAQTKIVVDLLKGRNPGLDIEVTRVRTLGDRMRQAADLKSAFTKEIDALLAGGGIDAAVHSLKDLPAGLEDGLVLAAFPPRGDPRDALVGRDGMRLAQLPPAPRIGTGSLRRRAQLKRLRGDAVVVEMRGNVDTRVSKVGGLDGVVLAAAGLERSGLSSMATELFDVEAMIPAVGQGIIAVEAAERDAEVGRLLRSIDDPMARAAADCERAFLARVGGDCGVPVAAHAEIGQGGLVRAVGMIASPDGGDLVRESASGAAAPEVGRRLADLLLGAGGRRLIEAGRRAP
ncbi:MAG: hydroxymethylbilane synthase [Nitrososphaerota archaeon]|nr:hydroxymethylbilane synthase [Nitrososphaerota archaeon]